MAIVLDGSNGISAPGLETFGDGTALGGATNPIVSMAKGANNYVQGYIVNNTNGANSSADIVCYPSNGTDTSGWIDMGITGPTFSQAAYGITGPNEGYIFMSALSGSGKTGNLVLATDSTGTQNAIKFATGGFGSTTERMRIDSSGNVGIGTSSPASKLHTAGTGTTAITVSNASSGTTGSPQLTQVNFLGFNNESRARIEAIDVSSSANGSQLRFYTANTSNALTETARIDTSGNLLVGTTTTGSSNSNSMTFQPSSQYCVFNHASGTASGVAYHYYSYNGTAIGSITQAGTTGVLYNVTSDYRLKNVIGAVTGAGERIDALEPIEYQWKSDGSNTRGFLAHKFQEVYPQSVSGDKDAVDEEGNPKYQTMQASTSEVIADLIAEIQSLRKRLTALENNKPSSNSSVLT